MRLPVFMLSEALRLIGATRTSLIGALGPVSALTMSAIGFDERLTGSQGFGAILVLSGVILISKSR
jgi:drug/metabolite transporter (DMT)-like permease